MAGTSSEMQRHAKEPTEALLFMLEHDRRMVAKEKEAKHKQEEEEKEMRKRSEERDRMTPSPAYQKAAMRGAAMREQELLVLQAKLAKMKWKNKRNRNKKMTAEAGKSEKAELKQRALPVSQEKLAKKKKPKNEDAGKTQDSVTESSQAGKAEELVTEAGRPEESAADMNSAGGDSFVGEEEKELRKRLEMLKTSSGMLIFPPGCSQEEMKDLLRMHCRDQDNERRAMAKRREERTEAMIESLEKSLEKEKIIEKSIKKEKRSQNKAKTKVKDDEAGKAEASVTEAGKSELEQRALLDSQETLANKKKAKDEEAEKAEASVTEAGKSELEQRALLDSQEKLANKKKPKDEEAEKAEASVTDAEKSVTEVGKSVTPASKAAEDAANTSNASNGLQGMTVFEDAESFGARFQSFWERCFSNFCAYDETTSIPAMCYTHSSDCDVSTMDTLQVISIRVASIKEGLRWPLQLFGTVSARDVVDRKRNIIFHRERDNCQTITEQDPDLTLTGPSRAVVVCDPIYIEVVLKVKGATESEDKELSRLGVIYRLPSWISGLYPSKLSTLELSLGLVPNSVEATVHVKVTEGSWPDGFKGVFTAANARNEEVKVKLLDVRDDGLPVDAADGMIKLSRRVVSVGQSGMLKLFVSACSAAGDEERCEASFMPAEAGVSSGVELTIGSCRMEATVAWSLFCDDY